MGMFDIDRSSDTTERDRQLQEMRIAAARERLRRIHGFYDSLRTHNPFAAKAESGLSFQQRIPSNAALSVGQAYIREHYAAAKDAISRRAVTELQVILGPDLLTPTLKYQRESRENLWQWLEVKIQLTLIQAKGEAMVEFVRENAMRLTSLDGEQQSELKAKIKTQLIAKEKEHKNWGLEEWLSEIVGKKLAQEIEKAKQQVPVSFGDLTEILYTLNAELTDKQSIGEQYLTRQQALNLSYAAQFQPRSIEATWQRFTAEMQAALSPRDEQALSAQIQRLRESRCADMPLHGLYSSVEGGKPLAFLVEEAIMQYSSANEADKSVLLQIIEVLLQHGDKPSRVFFDRQLDKFTWPVLLLILNSVDVATQFSELLRRELMAVAQVQYHPGLSMRLLSWTTVSDWVPIFPVTSSVSAENRRNATLMTKALCSGATGVPLDETVLRANHALYRHSWQLVGSGVGYAAKRLINRAKAGSLMIAVDASLFSQPKPSATDAGIRMNTYKTNGNGSCSELVEEDPSSLARAEGLDSGGRFSEGRKYRRG